MKKWEKAWGNCGHEEDLSGCGNNAFMSKVRLGPSFSAPALERCVCWYRQNFGPNWDLQTICMTAVLLLHVTYNFYRKKIVYFYNVDYLTSFH